VDSEHTAKEYLRHKVLPEKIVVSGHVAYDQVYQSFSRRDRVRADLVSKYDLDLNRKLLIVSVPQYAEQGYIDWDQHWHKIRAIVQRVSATHNNVLLSVHPRSNVAQYRFLEEEFPCRILEEPLADVIGAADLFLASNSSTFVWATLCGIHSIALWSPVRQLFEYMESVHRVEDESDLPSAIARMLASPPSSFENDWLLLSREEVFDGSFKERFMKLLEMTCKEDCAKHPMRNRVGAAYGACTGRTAEREG